MTRNKVAEAIERWAASSERARRLIPQHFDLAVPTKGLHELAGERWVATDKDVAEFSEAFAAAAALLRAAAEPEAKDEPPFQCKLCGVHMPASVYREVEHFQHHGNCVTRSKP